VRSKWIEHKGKQVFYADYTNLGHDASALEAELEAALEVVCAQPEHSVLVIVDVRGTIATGEVVRLFKLSAVKTGPYERKTAIVGITGYKKVLIDAVAFFSGRSFGAFYDLDAAKDWVIETESKP
jgi:hypothetical protein